MRHVPSIALATAMLLAAAPGHGQIPTPLLVYPDARNSSNPRVPCIPPVDRDGRKTMEVEAVFDYALAPLVRFPRGGTADVQVRDTPRRLAREIVALTEGDAKLVFRVGSASGGKLPELAWIDHGKEVRSVSGAKAMPMAWTGARIAWTPQEASLTIGEERIVLPLAKPFEPRGASVQTSQVSGLRIQGEGSLALEWRDGYAARVEPAADGGAVMRRLFGFDAYAVSTDPAKRDFPMIQVLNGRGEAATAAIDFILRGENAGTRVQWTQKVAIPARSGTMVPVQFPVALQSDIYHLDVRSNDPAPAYAEARHFLFAEPRPEAAGPAKFALHDSGRLTFGFWPDALPIPISHLYARWGYIQGPAWIPDPGAGADAPPAEWNWNTKIDGAIAQGLTPYVCIQSTPFAPWMRERDYPRMKTYPWGVLGGAPRLDLFRKFVRQLAERYKGKVGMYEVENEPNSHLGGIPPDDYAAICKAVWEETHAADPGVQVFGICGTSNFIPWIKGVFAAGGAKWMDGVSVHTYVTPRLPEPSGLAAKLAETKALIDKAGKPLRLVNSETGTYVAMREAVDRPIAPGRLAELIRQGVPNLAVPKGWPNYALDEWQGSTSIVRNAVYNFLGGAEIFTFFGWNDRWPMEHWWNAPPTESGQGCFGMVSASKDDERTPSLYTLAIAVLAEQLNGALLPHARPLPPQPGLAGGLFAKQNGGEVAVLWTLQGRRSILVATPDPQTEVVTLFGQRQPVSLSGGKFLLNVGEQPVYVHARQPGLRLLPPPVVKIVPIAERGQTSGFRYTLVNREKEPWKGEVRFPAVDGWKFTPPSQPFSLRPGESAAFQVACAPPAGLKRGAYPLDASLTLPDGTAFTFSLAAEVRPTLAVAAVAGDFAWDKAASWPASPAPQRLDQVDQVVVGRPPLLSSLQEETYWKGLAELSGEARVAANAEALFVLVRVSDANFRPPAEWPGVGGSCVELFLDTRAADAGQGAGAYGSGVRQFLLRPPGASGEAPQAWQASEPSGKAEALATAGGRDDGGYWIAVKVPWSTLGVTPLAGTTFGFDIGIDGPPADGPGRKSQLMLFGTASNTNNASGFGVASLPAPAP